MLGFLFCKMPYPVATKRMRCVSEVLVVGGRAFSERSCVVAGAYPACIRRHGEPLPHHLALSPQRKEHFTLTSRPVVSSTLAGLNALTCCANEKPRAIHSGLVCLAALFAFAPSIQRIYQAIIFLQAFSDKIYLCDKFCIFISLQLLHSCMVNLSLN